MSSKRMLACGTLLKQYHEELNVEYRDITIHVASEELDDTFTSRGGAPYIEGFDIKALSTQHINNSFAQTVQEINSRIKQNSVVE